MTRIRIEVLFLALTRPELMFGVPRGAVIANLAVTFIGGMFASGHTLWRSPFMFWAAGIPIHFVMRRCVARDYHAFRTAWLWAATTGAGIFSLRALPRAAPRSGAEFISSV